MVIVEMLTELIQVLKDFSTLRAMQRCLTFDILCDFFTCIEVKRVFLSDERSYSAAIWSVCED